MMLLEGKRLLITGVLTKRSIAWATAARAQELGAEVLLTSFGRARRLTEQAARRLPDKPEVLELDVNDDADHTALAGELQARWGAVDGALHAIAAGSAEALGGGFLNTGLDAAVGAFETTAFSYMRLARTVAPLLAAAGGGGYVGLDFEARPAVAGYDWMGVAKASMRSINRFLAAELGPHGIRCNLVSAGPLETTAGSLVPAMSVAARDWGRGAPLGWEPDDATPVGDLVCLLLSDLARGITGEVLHVDGGITAAGGWAPAEVRRPAADLAAWGARAGAAA